MGVLEFSKTVNLRKKDLLKGIREYHLEERKKVKESFTFVFLESTYMH